MQGPTRSLRPLRVTASRATLTLKDNIIIDNVEFSMPILTLINIVCQC